MNDRWYHEDISRPMAETLLAKAAQDGSFLVRHSESFEGALALCLLFENRIYTYRIFINEDNMLSVQASAGIKPKHFLKMPDLIEYYKQENSGLVTNLRYPVERVEEAEGAEVAIGASNVVDSTARIRSDASRSLVSETLARRLEEVDTAILAQVPRGFHKALCDYIEQDILKDAEHLNSSSVDMWQLRLLLSLLTKGLSNELIQTMSALETSQNLLDNQPSAGGSMQGQIASDTSVRRLLSTAGELSRVLSSIENQVRDYEPESPDADVQNRHVEIAPVFEVKLDSFGIFLKIHLKVDIENGKLIVKKSKDGPEEKFYNHNRILQLIKSQKFQNKLVIIIDSEVKKTQRKEYVFTDSKKREAFCQLMQLMKNKHSDFAEPDMINVFIGTWNMGNASPPADIQSWFLCRGQGKTRDDTAADIPHDIYIIGTQEDTQGEREWVDLIKSTLKNITYIKFKHIATQTLWNIRIVILAKPEHVNRISHISTSSVKTGIANALGNKGAVGVSFMFNGTSFGFVNSHLTSGSEKKLRRNQNYVNILRFLNLGDKKLSPFDITNRFTHLFWLGDLNYRVELPSQEAENIVEKVKQQQYQELLTKDQLIMEKNDKKVFLQFEEEEITFPPSYRYERDSRDIYNYIKQKATGLKYNLPSWCDRVLWKSYPNVHVMCQSYGCTTDIVTSDHSPVFATFEVGVSTQFVSKTDPNNAASPGTINFTRCEAKLKTKSKTKFFIEFHSSCLENHVKSADGENQESRDENLTVVWSSPLELIPIISDPEYLLDQHILICVKSTDSYESYGEGCIALQAHSNEIMFNIPLEHRGEETGIFSGSYKLTISERKQRERTYDFIQLEKDEMISVKQSKTNTPEFPKTWEWPGRVTPKLSPQLLAEEAAAKARDRVPLPSLPETTSKDDSKPSSHPESSWSKTSAMSYADAEIPPSLSQDQQSVGMVSNPLYEAVDNTQNSISKNEKVFSSNLRKGTPPRVEKIPIPSVSSANQLAQALASKESNRLVLPPVPQSRSRSYTCSELRRPGHRVPHAKQVETMADLSGSGPTSKSMGPPSPTRPPLPVKSQKVLQLQNAVKDYRETSELPGHAKHRGNGAMGQQTGVS
ncbi:phosphatidylinositol 3,4,5-trisphosphate 5-phosphatase 1 isoform X2 [Scyliorhinus torazame]|uniref:phosphatidylinositol 3,4,5-trisphosphate 5-phosphatase 1 isoform X2 n=1 Tax=Scyliorhinus torazame TaxID=75743 RepID=UPI003B59EB01